MCKMMYECASCHRRRAVEVRDERSEVLCKACGGPMRPTTPEPYERDTRPMAKEARA